MALTIPKHHKEWIQLLESLDNGLIKTLSNAYDQAKPTFSTEKLVASVIDSGTVSLEPDKIDGITDLLISLHYAYHEFYVDRGLEEFTKLVADSANDTLGDDSTWENLKNNLLVLLGRNNALLVTAKALNVLTDYDSIYRDARILTDSRPIFGNELEEEPLATMVAHTLKINYMKNGSLESAYIALDANDLRKLQEVLDRALHKESVLKSISRNNNITFLDVADLDN